MYGETHEIFNREFFGLPDMALIHKIYCSRIFSDLGYLLATKLSKHLTMMVLNVICNGLER